MVVAHSDVEAVAAFEHLGLIRTGAWPMVAAWLLDSGLDGNALATMAALDSHADGWDVDPLRADVLREIGAPSIEDSDRAALVVGATFDRVAGAGPSVSDHEVLRQLAALAPLRDYPAGLIGECYGLQEFLDCDCGPGSKAEADRLEDQLRTALTLELNPGLAAALALPLTAPRRALLGRDGGHR